MALVTSSARHRASATPTAISSSWSRSFHIASPAGAWQRVGSANNVRALLNDMQHAPGCQCHGCGIGAAQMPASRTYGNAAEGQPDYAFEMAASSIRYGRGVTAEVGMDMQNLGCSNVMVITDKNMAKLPVVQTVRDSLDRAGRDVAYFDDVSVEPTGTSFQAAIDFARNNGCDAFVSVGGGSVMDTAKAANLFATFPDHELLDFVNAPVGKGLPVPGTLRPHIAIPTTAGTGSETTGQAIFDYEPLNAKTGIGNRALKPTLGIIDPINMETMPKQVAIASGFDVLCHSLESYTAIPFDQRTPRPLNPNVRPAYQGSNPISDVWCQQSLKMLADNFLPAVHTDNTVAKEQMCLAATYAGVGFGNAGVHLCHGMSYPISGLNKGGPKWVHPEYESEPTPGGVLVPHGISVVISAPSIFRFTAAINPERHLKCAEILGADVSNAKATGDYAGNLLADEILKLMDATGVPMGISKLGFSREDIPALVAGTLPQERVTKLSPNPVGAEELEAIFEGAMEY